MRSPLIFVIDDSQTVCKILEVGLSRAGFTVISFPDGIEAMRWMTTAQARVPDLVIVDIGLPKMDGYSVIRRLKEKPAFAQTVFIVLTRRDGAVDRLKSRLAGAVAHLTKPFKIQEITAIITEHLPRAALSSPGTSN